MKLSILFAAAALTLTGCKTATTLSNAYSKVLNHADIEQPYREGNLIVLEAQAFDLYPTEDFKRKCPVANISFDAANGVVNAKVKCYPDSIKALNGVGGKLVELMLPREK